MPTHWIDIDCCLSDRVAHLQRVLLLSVDMYLRNVGHSVASRPELVARERRGGRVAVWVVAHKVIVDFGVPGILLAARAGAIEF